MHFFNKAVKKLDAWDLVLIRLSVIAFAFFLLRVWTGLMSWVHSMNFWWFFAAWLILAARPVYRRYLKKKKR